MSAPKDWPPSPAKWIAVLILGAASAAGISHSALRDSTPWRNSVSQPSEVARSPGMVMESLLQSSKAARAAAAIAPAIKININTATKSELELLNGIGPSLADRIIAERQRGGPFGRVEDLSRVRGIGAKTIERLRAHAVCESVAEPPRPVGDVTDEPRTK